MPIEWGDPLTDEQCEALREVQPAGVGGDSDWRLGVTYLFDLPDGAVVSGDGISPDVHIPPGTFIRTVKGKREDAWFVHGRDAAAAYVEQIERTWIEETGG